MILNLKRYMIYICWSLLFVIYINVNMKSVVGPTGLLNDSIVTNKV